MKTQSFAHDDPNCIWVASSTTEDQRGTYDKPFGNINAAIEKAQPGSTVVLKDGTYNGDVTVQKSGTIDHPLRIVAENDLAVVFKKSCWYFYDVSDLIVAGISFFDSPNAALSVVGSCERNIFHTLQFSQCGLSEKEGCTVFLGGSGSSCNVIENCTFDLIKPASGAANTIIGIVVTDGDEQEDMLNRDMVINYNRFSNYDCGIVVGTRGLPGMQFGHLVENNMVENCTGDGIRIKCGDTRVLSNRISNCRDTGIAVSFGDCVAIEDNRIENCRTGMSILGSGHSVAHNCLVDFSEFGCVAKAAANELEVSTENLIFDHNTCAVGTGAKASVYAEKGTSCIANGNITSGVVGFGSEDGSELQVITDNVCDSESYLCDGFSAKDIAFIKETNDDYRNESKYGAKGWAALGGNVMPYSSRDDMAVSFDPDDPDEERKVDSLIKEVDRKTLLSQSMFFEEDEE